MAQQTNLRINCTLYSPNEVFFIRILEEACRQLNITVDRNTTPVARSLSLVNQGIDDGDGPRLQGLTASFPNMIRVTESFGEFHFGAFAKSRKIKIDGWDGLKAFDVAYLRGWKLFDLHVNNYKSFIILDNVEKLFGLLDGNRTEIVLTSRMIGYTTIKKLNLKNIQFIEPPLAIKATYLYLNKRHRILAVKLSQVLKKLKKDGTYNKLYMDLILSNLPDTTQ